MMAIYTDVGALIGADCAAVGAVITAGAGNDGVEVDGPTIDRFGFSDRGMSGSFLIPFKTVMATLETLTVATQIQDSANGSSWADFDGPAPLSGTKSTVFGGASGAQTLYKCHKHDIDLRMARRYIRVQHTLTLSAVATDTVAYAGALVVGGMQELPGTGEEA